MKIELRQYHNSAVAAAYIAGLHAMLEDDFTLALVVHERDGRGWVCYETPEPVGVETHEDLQIRLFAVLLAYDRLSDRIIDATLAEQAATH